MKRGILSALALIALATGCATVDRKPAVPLTGNILTDGPVMISNGPPRDKVLWQYRTAAAALRAGDYAQAKTLLDDALLTLGGIYGKDKSAKKSRSYFSAESKKTFIGEPYERVMAYYYRGLLYWMDGEADNARACFRTGELEDSSEEEHYSSDYALLDYLDGFATSKLGGDGSDAFARAVKLCTSGEKPPPYDPQARALFFVEFGPGPTKICTGEYREKLRFRVPESLVTSALLKINTQTIRLAPYDDLGFQATTRGGRVMDHVLANKAVFKTTTAAIGTAAIVGGLATAAASRDKTAQEVGLGIAAAGVMVGIISGLTTPAADVRAWDNLPRYLAFAAVRLPPGQHTATIEFLGKEGQAFPNLTKNLAFDVHDQSQDTIVFVSDRSKDGQQLQINETDPAKIAGRVQTAAANFDRDVIQKPDHPIFGTGISKTLIFRAKTDVYKAQQALVRSVGLGNTKWRIFDESSLDADTLMIRMIGRTFLGQSRLARVQLSQVADSEVEVRAKITTFPNNGGGLANPDILLIVTQVEDRACANFRANLEKELGTPLRTATD